MLEAFIIWSVLAVFFIVMGFITRFSKKPAGFWANAKVPEIDNVKAYNEDLSIAWFIFGLLFETLGLPFLRTVPNDPTVFLVLVFVPFLVIGMMITYTKIEGKYRKK